MKRTEHDFKLARAASLVAFALVASVSGVARAGDTDACSLYEDASPTQLLRRLSLDLRNRVPDYDEYAAVLEAGAVSDDLVEGYLASDEFRVAMRRFHETFLWPNVGAVNLSVGTHVLDVDQPTGLYYMRKRRDLYRGGDGTHICRDVLQKDFAGGMPVAKTFQGGTADAYQAEGYVMVAPYWAPDQKIKVCAFDAQEAAKADDVRCDAVEGGNRKGCGCGPDLRFCYGPKIQDLVIDDMREQLLRLVDDSTVGGAPYSDILTTKRAWRNGHLAYWEKHLAYIRRIQNVFTTHQPEDTPLPANPKWADDWESIERPEPHSGVFTLAAYTLRFQTNRGRANRFRIAFMDQYFEPPGVQDSKCSVDAPDVTERCVCRHCHMELEPLAAHFEPFSEGGSSVITGFEEHRPECVGSDDKLCARFYITDPKADRPGWLIPLQYADGKTPIHDAILAGTKAGPAELAKQAIESGAFARATVVHLWQQLMGRDPNLDPSSEDSEQSTIDELAAKLQADDDFKAIVKAIISLPAYRRMR